jgi:hypothetical protein
MVAPSRIYRRLRCLPVIRFAASVAGNRPVVISPKVRAPTGTSDGTGDGDFSATPDTPGGEVIVPLPGLGFDDDSDG